MVSFYIEHDSKFVSSYEKTLRVNFRKQPNIKDIRLFYVLQPVSFS